MCRILRYIYDNCRDTQGKPLEEFSDVFPCLKEHCSSITLDPRLLKQPCGKCKECKKKPSPLAPGLLTKPAEVALKVVLARTCSTPYMKRLSLEIPSEDARLVLQACQALERSRDEDKVVLDNGLYFATAKAVVPTLSYVTRLKLSLVTWNFTASSLPSGDLEDLKDLEGLECLNRFLRQGSDKVWRTFHTRYQEIMGQNISLKEFKETPDVLLLPGLRRTS